MGSMESEQCDTGDFLLIQPVDAHDAALMDQELAYIKAHVSCRFRMETVLIQDWNRDLSPWQAPPVFGNEGFGDGAKETLQGILALAEKASAQTKVILGGYSLAGLFALWSAYQTDRFDAIAAASPSVWFPDWLAYAKSRTLLADTVYLSLGDKEEQAKQPQMAKVGDCIRALDAHYEASSEVRRHILEWNEGNHFRESEIRTAKAFVWCMTGDSAD